MMKVTHKGRAGTDPSQLIRNDKAAGQTGRDRKTEVGPTVESAKVNISKKARELQRIAEPLARKGDDLRAEEIKQLKQIIAKGEYEVDARKVAKSIIRNEVSRHLEKSKVQSMNIDLTELFALIEEEIAVGKQLRRNVEQQKKTVVAWDVITLSQQIDAQEPSPGSSTFSSRRIPC
jgi:flagellar biosynthesis anti-sigma factor FlgM